MVAMLLGAHALADYPLQGSFLARAKNRRTPIPGVPWYQAMLAHAAIQGLGVGLVTDSIGLGLLEVVAHSVIDDARCAGRLTYDQDQVLHVLCKVVWASLACPGRGHRPTT